MVIGDIARFPADNWTMRVRMVDSQPGARSEAHEWEFELPRITLRALLRSRVAREVEAYNVKLPEVFHGLVQPEESERILNGYRLQRARPLDAEQQYQRAIRAFNTNGFVVLAGGRQIESLDEEIDLETATEVEFLKLVPLIGG
jgi:hypothetical protein